jgi:AGCS family alanine or glycine:cation symporter
LGHIHVIEADRRRGRTIQRERIKLAELLFELNESLNDFVWSKIILMCVLIGGIYFTLITGGVQIRKLGYSFKHVFGGRTADRPAAKELRKLGTFSGKSQGAGEDFGKSVITSESFAKEKELRKDYGRYRAHTGGFERYETENKSDGAGGKSREVRKNYRYNIGGDSGRHSEREGHKKTLRKKDKGSVSQFQAVSTALAGTLGTGSIIGVGQAIAMGGPGAIFWMWAAALLGMVIKYSEIVLAVRFREKNQKGEYVGGPMYYIKNGMGEKWRWLGCLFCVFAILASFGIGNMAQGNSVAAAVTRAAEEFKGPWAEPGTVHLVTGIALAALVGATMFGGAGRTGRVCEALVPFMSICYLALGVVVIISNREALGPALKSIVDSAFTPEAAAGGATGVALKTAVEWGLRRSAFSNEAGLGSAAIAHASADTKEPVSQGLFGIFEVFVDTVLVCTITAVMLMVSGVEIEPGTTPGAELVISAFAGSFGGKAAAMFVAVMLALFAFSTLIGWALYGVRCACFLFGDRAERPYRVVFVLLAAVGTMVPAKHIWSAADTFNGLMAVPNFIALFAMSGTVAKLTREYFGKSGADRLKYMAQRHERIKLGKRKTV